MNQKTLVSIIVPVYNVQHVIRKCIDSLIIQTYRNIEIILVDDGSTDTSGVIIDEYKIRDHRIKTIHVKNGGVTNARKLGFEYSIGNYCMFVDGDDSLVNDAVGFFMNIFEKYDYDFISGWYNKIYDDGNIEKVDCPLIGSFSVIEYIKKITKKGIPSICIGIFKRKLFDETIFNIDRKFYRGEDSSTLVGLINNMENIYCTNKIFYHYYQRNDSVTHTVQMTLEYILELINMRYLRFRYEYRKYVFPKLISDKLDIYYSMVERDMFSLCKDGKYIRKEILENKSIKSVIKTMDIKHKVKYYTLKNNIIIYIILPFIKIYRIISIKYHLLSV